MQYIEKIFSRRYENSIKLHRTHPRVPCEWCSRCQKYILVVKNNSFWLLDVGNTKIISWYHIQPGIIETTVLYFLRVLYYTVEYTHLCPLQRKQHTLLAWCIPMSVVLRFISEMIMSVNIQPIVVAKLSTHLIKYL